MWRVVCAVLSTVALMAFAEPALAAGNGQLAAVFGGDRLVTLNPDGTNQRTLWVPPEEFGTVSQPAWSPDGNRLAFVHWDSAHGPRIGVVDLGGQMRYVSDHPGPSAAGVTQDIDPGWSPDGRVVFRRIPPGAGSQPQALMSVAADGSDLRTLPDAPDPSTAEVVWLADGSFVELEWFLRGAAISPDAAWLVYRSSSSHAHLVIGPLDDDDERDLTAGGPQLDDRDPAFSPDGASVVYVNGENQDYGVREELRVVDVQSAAARTVLGGNFHEPAWQPCVAGVTVSCTSPRAPSCVTDGTPRWRGEPVPPPCLPLQLPPPRLTPPAPSAPLLVVSGTPKLDRHGRVLVRARCIGACTVTLRLSTRLNTGRVVTGRAVTASTPKRFGTVSLRLKRAKLPVHRRAVATRIVGTVWGANGLSRPFTLKLR